MKEPSQRDEEVATLHYDCCASDHTRNVDSGGVTRPIHSRVQCTENEVFVSERKG